MFLYLFLSYLCCLCVHVCMCVVWNALEFRYLENILTFRGRPFEACWKFIQSCDVHLSSFRIMLCAIQSADNVNFLNENPLVTLLASKLLTLILPILKCTDSDIQYIHNAAPVLIHFYNPKENSYPLNSHSSQLPSLHPLENSNLLSISVDLSVLEIS